MGQPAPDRSKIHITHHSVRSKIHIAHCLHFQHHYEIVWLLLSYGLVYTNFIHHKDRSITKHKNKKEEEKVTRTTSHYFYYTYSSTNSTNLSITADFMCAGLHSKNWIPLSRYYNKLAPYGKFRHILFRNFQRHKLCMCMKSSSPQK